MTFRTFHAPGAVGRAALLLLAIAVTACGPRDEPGAVPAPGARADEGKRAAPADTGRAMLERADESRIQGAPTAKVWLVEISDYQCPYCRRWHEETYPVIRDEYISTGKIRFAYLNLPLPNHKHAAAAAELALCAGLQGRYWEMHDAIFRTQQRWSALESATATFDSLAAPVVPDLPALRACVADRRTRPLVAADYERAVSSGVRSTPTFIVGGSVIQGAAPAAEFRRALDSALAAATRP